MKKRGFTLIELIVVIAILGILVIIALPNFISSYRSASDKAMITQENEVVDAAKLFVEDYCRHPLQSNKGQCSTYSVATSETNKKYTCLSTLQLTKYMDPIVSQGQNCGGFIIYDKDYSSYKAYLKCGNGYATAGIDGITDSHGNKIIDICMGEVTPEEPTPTVTDNYQNTTTGAKYETLSAALNAVESNQTIKVLKNATETTQAILASGKTGVTLNLNGKTITASVSGLNFLENNGSLSITSGTYAGGTIAGTQFYMIRNNGSLSVIDAKLYSTQTVVFSTGRTSALDISGSAILQSEGNSSSAVSNGGTLTMTSGTITSAHSALWNTGIANISGGEISAGDGSNVSGYNAISNQGTGVLTISGTGTLVTTTNGDAIQNYGNTTIIGGTIRNSTDRSSYIITNAKDLTINGGTFTGTGGFLNLEGGVLTIGGSSTSINTASRTGISNSGTLTFSEATLISGGDGIVLGCSNYEDAPSVCSTATITSGTIKAAGDAILSEGGASIITIGINDSNVSSTSPIIETTAAYNKYGIKVSSDGIFNFYDGVIKSSSGTGYAISKNPNSKPSGYSVHKSTSNGVETATLSNSNNYVATFYYNSNATNGSLTVSTATASCSTQSTSCSVTIPSVVTNSVGKYNSTYKGVSTEFNMNTVNSGNTVTISSDTSFYANYQSSVLVYYYGTAYTSKMYNRNEFFTSNSAMTARLADPSSTNQTSNYDVSSAKGPGNSSWYGLSTGKDAVIEYNSVQAAANANGTSLYSVYSFDVNFAKGANVSAIGSTSTHCEVTSTDTSCVVMLPSITANSGYSSVGWNTTSGATTGTAALGVYTVNQNNLTLYANAMGINYENTNTGTRYATLNEAFSNVASNQTIKVLLNTTETTTATLASGKTRIKLDLNGHTITSSATNAITNNGTLDIYNSSSTAGKITGSGTYTVYNNGTLTTNGTSSTRTTTIENTKSSSGYAIYNLSSKTFTMNANTQLTNTNGYGLLNSGTATINDGSITGKNAIGNNASSTLNVNGGTINSTGAGGISNSGTVTVSGGTITGSTYGINNNSGASLTVSGSSTQITGTSSRGIYNQGGTLTISGGTITGPYGVHNTNNSTYTGTTTITGGTITGTDYGIYNNQANLTLGANNISVSTSSPVVQATGTSNKYGVYNDGGTLNFYDGIVKSSSGTDKSIYGTVTNTPNGYAVYKETTNGIESAYLRAQSSYTATIYYNSNTTAGNLTVRTATVSCTANSGETCQVAVPSEVTSSVGKQNGAYKGVSSSTGNMNNNGSGNRLTLSSDARFYANYQSQVLIYYYGTSYTSKNYNRNEYFTSNSAMTAKIAETTATDQTANYDVSNAKGPGNSVWYGLSTGKDSEREYETVQLAANASTNQLYSVYSFNVTFARGANVMQIGSTSTHCEVTSTDTSCMIMLPSITTTSSYTSVGWSTTNGDTTGTSALGTYMVNQNDLTLYANAVSANYENTTTGLKYSTLSAALNNVASNQTIKVLKNTTETTSATLASGKTGVKLDLNGKTITSSSNYTIVNDGTLDIYNSSSTTGTIETSGGKLIYNNGQVTVNGTSSTNVVTLKSTYFNNPSGEIIYNNTGSSATINNNVNFNIDGLGINNNGTVTLNGGTITAEFGILNASIVNVTGSNARINANYAAVQNHGNLTISAGTLSSSSGSTIDNQPGGVLNISGSSTLIEGASGVSNHGESSNFDAGKVYITNGTIKGSNDGIRNYGKIEISGSNTKVQGLSGHGIYNDNEVTISGGTITGSTSGIHNSNIAKINGGTITGTQYGIENGQVSIGSTRFYGNTTITGGTITSTNGEGIKIISGTTLTLGTNDSSVSTSSPVIHATGTSNKLGIVNEGGTFNFYDGIIKSSSGTGKAIYGTVSDIPTGYSVYKETVSGVESAYLKAQSSYTATFYYNSNPNSGNLTISTATASCIANAGESCQVTVPSVVTSSVGKQNGVYKGVSTSTGNMNNNSSSNKVTISGNTRYYANYQNTVLIYYYGTSYTSKNYYRNEFFTSTSTMVARLVETNASDQTTNYSVNNVKGPANSAWYGLSDAKDSAIEHSTVQSAADTASLIFYSVYSFTVNFAKGANVSSIGSTSTHCEVTSTDTSCTIMLPSITPNTGYVSAGWNTTSGATTGTAALGTYVINSNALTLYANAVEMSYQITNTGTKYATLNAAFNAVARNQTIKVLNNTTETSLAALTSGKTGVKLDLNGKTITSTASNYGIYNLGGLEIYSSVNGGTITSSADVTIYNDANLTINKSNSGTLTIKNEKTSGSYGTALQSSNGGASTPNLEVYSSNYISTNGVGIQVGLYGTAKINGANIQAGNIGILNENYNDVEIQIVDSTIQAGNVGISNEEGNLYLENVTITSMTNAEYGDGIANGGTINFYQGNISVVSTGLYNGGIFNMYEGTISGDYKGIENRNQTAIYYGTIKSKTEAILNQPNSVLTIGDNSEDMGGEMVGDEEGIDYSVSTTDPRIELNDSSTCHAAIFSFEDTTVNFYDGRIVSNCSRNSLSIDLAPTVNLPDDYFIFYDQSSGIEEAYLAPRNYQNTSTGTYYQTLNEAFSNIDDNHTIKVLTNVTERNTTNTPGGVSCKLDLNGKTITYSSGYFKNNLTLDIYNSSNTAGTITSRGTYTIYNSGTLTINGTSGAKTTNIINTSTSGYALYNYTGKTVTINNNSRLTGVYRTLYTANNTTLNLGKNDGSVSTTSPIVETTGTGTNAYGVYLYSNAVFNFYDGKVTSAAGTGKSIYGNVASIPSGYELFKETVSGTESAYLKTQASYTATFYYNSNTTAGSLTVSSATAQCSANTGQSCTVDIPSVVTSSVGKQNSAYKGVSSSTGNMNNNSSSNKVTISANTTFYTNYQSQVLIYYYGTSYTSKNYNRNEYFTSNSAMTASLAETNASNQTVNYTTAGGPGSSVWYGLSNGVDAVREYTTVQSAASSSYDKLYTVYSFNVTFAKGANVSTIGSTSTHCEVTSTDTSCTIVLPSITANSGYGSVGWSTTNGATTGTAALGLYTVNTNPTTLYANAIGTNYENTSTGNRYATLASAFSSVGNNQTIKVLNNVTETTVATLASGKTEIKLDLNGKTITLNNVYITNNGELDIYNSSSTNGTITGNYESVINNAGGLTLNGTSYTNEIIINNTSNSSLAAIMNGSDSTVNFGVNITSQAAGIFNSGNLTVENGRIRGNTSGIENYNFVAVNGGDILGTTYSGIQNSGMAVMSGGVASSSQDGIFNMGHIEINGAAIEGDNGINNYGGTAIIKSGTITGTTRGIFNTVSYEVEPAAIGSLTLGTNDSSVSINSPVIEATDTSGAYGVYNSGTFNFYDGIVKSSSGTGKAISGTITSFPSGYEIYKSTTSGVESAYPKVLNGYTATFYYNSNTAAGGLTVATATANCTAGTGQSCTVTVPTAVRNSVGKQNSTYKGVSSSTGNMNNNSSSNTVTINANTTYYANYSSDIIISYPTSTTASGTTTYKRNEYFTSATAMNSVIANNATSTSSASFNNTVSGYDFIGFAEAVSNNNAPHSSLTNVANSALSNYYALYRKQVTATFYYNSNTTAGSLTVSTAQATRDIYVRCKSSGAEISYSTLTVPSVVTSSVGKQNSAYKGVSTSTSSMGSSSLDITANTTFYANYSSKVLIYYYGTSYTSKDYYRNEFFTSTTAMGARLANSNDSTTNYSTASGPGSSVWNALANSQSSTEKLTSVQAAADKSYPTLYTFYRFNVTFTKGANVSSIGSTSSYCDVTSTNTSCSVTLPTITPLTGANSVGWSTTDGVSSGTAALGLYTISTNPTTLYANASIVTPDVPTITGGTTKVFNYQANSITCSSSTTYGSGISKYYEFGYSSPTNETITWLGNPSTTATYSFAKDAFRGTRYYTCRVYAKNTNYSTTTSAVAASSSTTEAIVNARIDFDATTNSGTISGTTPLYASYENATVYTGRTNATAGTIPTATRSGYEFSGWYTASSGGTKVINADGTIVASVTNWTNASKQFVLTNGSSTQNTNRLYAQFTQSQSTLTINPNGGSYNGSTANTTVTQNLNTTYSVLHSTTKAGYVFNGYTLSGGGTYVKYDSSITPTETNTFNFNSSSSTLPGVYNNSGGGTVTNSMVADSSAPSGGYALKVVTNGTASPSAGGFSLDILPNSSEGRINVIQFKAKIPVGYTINQAGISGVYTGIGSSAIWVDNTGTGAWKDYTCIIYMGDAGNLGNRIYIYLNGSNNTAVTWYVNQVVLKSYTKAQFKSTYTFASNNGTLTANYSTGGAKVTFNTNGGTFDTTKVKSWSNGYYGANSTTAYRLYNYATAYPAVSGDNYNGTPDSRVVTRPGYSFNGWYTASSGGTKVFNADGSLVASVSGYSDSSSKWIRYSSNANLYAQWSPMTYLLTKVFDNNLVPNGDFESYTIADAPTKTLNGVTHSWDKSLNGIPGNTEKAYNATGWGRGQNMGVTIPELGYHAHMKSVSSNMVFDFKTNEAYAGKTKADAPGGVTVGGDGTIAWNRWIGISQALTASNFTAGQKYVITADVYRVSGGNYPNVGLYHCNTANGTSANFYSGRGDLKPTATGQWQTLSWTFTLDSTYTTACNPTIYVYGHYGEPGEFYVDNVKLEKVDAAYNVTYGSNYTSTHVASTTKSGYTFNGWFGSNQSTTALTTSTAFSNTTATFEDINTAGSRAYIYAKWTPKPFRIYYNTNGGTVASGSKCRVGTGADGTCTADSDGWTMVGSSFAYQQCTYGSTCNLWNYNNSSYLNITRTGYTAPTGAQWYAKKANNSTATMNHATDYTYEELKSYIKSEESTYYSIWLYVNWTPAVYTITLNNNGASTAGTTAIYEKYNTGIYKNSDATGAMTTSSNAITVPTKGGSTFVGYFTSASGGTELINGNGYITNAFDNNEFTANTTLYAHWQPRCSVDYYKNCPNASLAYPTGSTYVYSKTSGTKNSTYAEGILYMNNNSVDRVYYIAPAENGFTQLVVVHKNYCQGFGIYTYYTGDPSQGCNSSDNIRTWGFELITRSHYTQEPAYVAYMASGCVTFEGNDSFTFNCKSNSPSSYSGGGTTPTRYCYLCAVPPNAVWYQWAYSNPGSNYCTSVNTNYCN